MINRSISLVILGIIFAALSSVESSILFDTRPQRPLPNKRSADYNATPTPGDPLYDGCGMWKGCFGYPGGADCIKTQSCTAMTTFKPVMNGSFIEFEIYGNNVPTNGYVAVGISTDDKMGNDSVIQCVNYMGSLSAYNSVNVPGGCPRIPFLPGFALNLAGYMNGRLYCRVMQPTVHSVTNTVTNTVLKFDLKNQNYYLLIAMGPTGSDAIQYHMTNKWASNGVVNTQMNMVIGEEASS